MKKAYFRPELRLMSYGIDDVIMSSLNMPTNDIGGDDWGVRDVF